MDLEGLEEIYTVVATHPHLKPGAGDIIIIFCEIGSPHSEDDIIEFRSSISQALQEGVKELHINQENILLDGSSLKKKISDEIERKIMFGFQTIGSSLIRFDLVEGGSNQTESILETSLVVNSVHGFLRNPSIFEEIMSFDGVEKDNEKFLESVLSNLCRVIKCAAVSPLAKKYSLRSEVCNSLLHEIDFEEALANSVSKNTRHHMLKLVQTKARTCHKFDFLLYPLQKDMKTVFERMEEKMSSMKRFAMVIRRLRFETDGYLKQSAVASESQPETPKIPEQLRRDILNMQGVYGIGTLYGRLEIHLDKADEQSTTEKSNNIQMEDEGLESEESTRYVEERQMETDTTKKIPDLRKEIALEMNRQNFHYPYTVRFVKNEPVVMNGRFEPGDTLVSPTEKTGTLGAFANSKDGKLYGLTCAHVVDGSQTVFLEKEGKNLFSDSQKIVRTGQDQCPLIDIAALKVIRRLQSHCKQNLENNVDLVTKVGIAMDSPGQLVGRFVHKFGAKTYLTKGVIISVDYSKFGPNADDYIVIVDPVAADNSEDLSDLSRELGSLLVTSPQDNDGQYAEAMNTQENDGKYAEAMNTQDNDGQHAECMNTQDNDGQYAEAMKTQDNVAPNAKAVAESISDETKDEHADLEGDLRTNESCSSQNDNLPISENSTKHKRRKLEPKMPLKLQGLHNETTSHIDELKSSGEKVVYTRKIYRVSEGPDVNYIGHQNTSGYCASAKLYVRNVNETDIANCDPMSVFAAKGDSGSVICAQDLLHTDRRCIAISMLSAGDLDVEGLDGKKALSFMLKDGLAKLLQHYELGFV